MYTKPSAISKSSENMSKDNYEERLDRIIEWVKTCDNKATTLLSVTALVLTILLAGDYIMTGMQTILSSAYNPDLTEPSVCGIIAVVFFVFSILLLLASLICCILVVRAKTKEDLVGNKTVKKDSLIHFNHISELTYEQYKDAIDKETDDMYIEDLKSQIYINAVRCSQKFKTYNLAVLFMCGAIPSALIYIIFTVFFLAQI